MLHTLANSEAVATLRYGVSMLSMLWSPHEATLEWLRPVKEGGVVDPVWSTVFGAMSCEWRHIKQAEWGDAAHDWWYVKGMTTDEALVFKCYDSRRGTARFTPHTGGMIGIICRQCRSITAVNYPDIFRCYIEYMYAAPRRNILMSAENGSLSQLTHTQMEVLHAPIIHIPAPRPLRVLETLEGRQLLSEVVNEFEPACYVMPTMIRVRLAIN